MLKKGALKERQLTGLNSILETIALVKSRLVTPAATNEQPTLVFDVHQLAGTGMAELQLGTAITATDDGWRCLIVQPDCLAASINHTLTLASKLAPAPDISGINPTGNPKIVIATAQQIVAATTPTKGDDDEMQPPRFAPDAFQLIILNNSINRSPQNFAPITTYFSGAFVTLCWSNSQPGTVFPPTARGVGIIMIIERQPAAATPPLPPRGDRVTILGRAVVRPNPDAPDFPHRLLYDQIAAALGARDRMLMARHIQTNLDEHRISTTVTEVRQHAHWHNDNGGWEAELLPLDSEEPTGEIIVASVPAGETDPEKIAGAIFTAVKDLKLRSSAQAAVSH
jgi:hypothetical protein